MTVAKSFFLNGKVVSIIKLVNGKYLASIGNISKVTLTKEHAIMWLKIRSSNG